MALTKEQAKAFYDKAVEAGYSDDEIVAELKKRNATSAPAPAPLEENNEGDPIGGDDPMRVKIKTPLQTMEEKLQGGAMDRFGAGLSRSLEGVDTGARKLVRSLLGGDEQEMSDREAQTRALFERYDPKGSGMSATDLGKLAGDVGTFAAMPGRGALAATGTGALQGALQPTTENESIAEGAMLGAAGGLAGQQLGSLLGKGVDAWRRVDTPEAIESLTSQMGAARGAPMGPQYEALTGAVESQRDRLAQALSQRYNAVEGMQAPAVGLQNASRLGGGQLDLPEEVINSLNPGAARTMAALQRGSTRTSPILDVSGAPIQQARDVSFKDVRDTVRALRTAKRAMPYTDAGIARGRQIDNIIERLDDDLAAWANASPEADDILRTARQVDADYADQVAPFQNKDSVLGALRRGAADEGAVNRLFLGENKGQALEELLTRVPESRGPARALFGNKLLQEAGDISTIRKLEGGTSAEQLLSAPEREYARAIASNIRDNKGSGNLDLARMLRSLLRTPVLESMGGRRIDTVMTGMLPYGQEAVDTTLLQQLLRSYGAGELSGE